MTRGILAWSAIASVVALVLIGLGGAGVGEEAEAPIGLQADRPCVPHGPIEITEDEGTEGFILGHDPATGQPIYRPGSGVVAGNGTPEDPYVIEGWCALQGIYLEGTTAHVTIQANEIEETRTPDRPLELQGVENVTVRDNHVLSGDHGVWLDGTRNVIIDGNTVTSDDEGDPGIVVWTSENVHVRNNVVPDPHDRFGIVLLETRDADVSDNTVGDGGLHLVETSSTTVSGNTFQEDGLFIQGDEPEHYRHTIDDTNTVHGETIHYVQEAEDAKIENHTGQLFVTHSSNVTVTGLTVDQMMAGAGIAFSDNITVEDANVTDTQEAGIIAQSASDLRVTGSWLSNTSNGIELHESNQTLVDRTEIRDTRSRPDLIGGGVWGTVIDGLTVQDSKLIGGDTPGVFLQWSEDVHVERNTITETESGVSFYWTENATVTSNYIQQNARGAYLESSSLVDLRENWWGHSSGPSGQVEDACTGTVADGQGQPIRTWKTPVCFDSWLTSPTMGET